MEVAKFPCPSPAKSVADCPRRQRILYVHYKACCTAKRLLFSIESTTRLTPVHSIIRMTPPKTYLYSAAYLTASHYLHTV